jgi:hypothetical protein
MQFIFVIPTTNMAIKQRHTSAIKPIIVSELISCKLYFITSLQPIFYMQKSISSHNGNTPAFL